MDRWIFCRNCLKLRPTTSLKKFVSCSCNSRTSIRMASPDDIFKKVQPSLCPNCHHAWFSRSKKNNYRCSKCKKLLHYSIFQNTFAKYWFNTGLDNIHLFLNKFRNVSKSGLIIMISRLNPEKDIDTKTLNKFYYNRKAFWIEKKR